MRRDGSRGKRMLLFTPIGYLLDPRKHSLVAGGSSCNFFLWNNKMDMLTTWDPEPNS